MLCRKCKNEIPDGSIFCNWCGTKQLKERRGSTDISVPKARQLSSGKWFIQLRLDGKSIPVTCDSERECHSKALMLKTEHMNGLRKENLSTPNLTLRQCCDKYLNDHRAALSPSTMRGYTGIVSNRFRSVMNTKVEHIGSWQTIVNRELENISVKTAKNSFGFICSVLKYAGYPIPSVKFPQSPKPDTPWLNYEQILQFCDAIRGESCELGALLALHSLRKSEILALTGDKIDKKNQRITVRGSLVQNEHNVFVQKDVNKTQASQRVVPFLIPRLAEVIPDAAPGEQLVKAKYNTLYHQINRVCDRNGLPRIGIHGLRRSFASLAYHLGWPERVTMEIGGWDDVNTMHKMYVKLAEKDKLIAAAEMSNFYAECQV